jgi:TolB-like protein
MKRTFVLFSLLSGLSGAATNPTVAVMPFKDLSGGKGNVGEAIRETVTSDLKDVSGLRVIERGRIDQILSEQHLQENKAELDAASTVKVGKLLGASMIVTGAYQKAASSVRLTARFVKVETGEVVGSAKVDGGASDFLRLQDKVTVELLRSAGIEQKQVQRFTERARPKLKSMKPIELYGDALVEADEGKKKQLLLAALNEDPSFVYATRDLDALEQRLKDYDAVMRAEQDKAIRELRSTMDAEKDPMQRYMKVTMLLGNLAAQRRWRTLQVQAREIAKNPPKTPPNLPQTAGEIASYYVVMTENTLQQQDALLRDGEKFLATYPASMYAGPVKMYMEQVIDQKRKTFEGEQRVAAAVNALNPQQRGDLCQVAGVYKENDQLREARRLYEACLTSGHTVFQPGVILEILVVTAQQQGDFAGARRYMTQLEKADEKTYRQMKGVMMTWPAD